MEHFFIHTNEPIDCAGLPLTDNETFARSVIDLVHDGGAVSALYATQADAALVVRAVVSCRARGEVAILGTVCQNKAWVSLTPRVPEVHLFEREMAEQWGIHLTGHPWLKPVRFHRAWADGNSPLPLPGVTRFFELDGEEVHEVAVGPVHAGIIEPGHFRFSCHGENVFHLEIALGFQHRGIERAMRGGPDLRTIHLIETLAGDTSIGHAFAHCQALEALSGTVVPLRGQVLRAVALELERCANHTGDLGALAQDVGFLPTASYCGRLRGDFLNMTALLCGSRFGRGLVRPGGVAFELDQPRIDELLGRMKSTMKDLTNAVTLLWDTPSVVTRFERTGTLSAEMARELGLVGPAARASGLSIDVRQDFPNGIYQFFQIPVSTWHTGDVFARAYVRWLEIQHSAAFIEEQLRSIPEGPVMLGPEALHKGKIVVSMVEGWRGEICHCIETDSQGKFSCCKVIDPSFHNWTGLAMALRNQQISDFPVCNKSFNLSYCGHDL